MRFEHTPTHIDFLLDDVCSVRNIFQRNNYVFMFTLAVLLHRRIRNVQTRW